MNGNMEFTEYLLSAHNSLVPSNSSVTSKLLPQYDLIGFKAVQDLYSSLKCNICTMAFNSSKELKLHKMQSHEKQSTCQVCSKQFSNKYSLKTHERIHSADNPYKCTLCGKGFTQNSNLKDHERIHSGEKPFICTVCGKDFNNKSNFHNHLTLATSQFMNPIISHFDMR